MSEAIGYITADQLKSLKETLSVLDDALKKRDDGEMIAATLVGFGKLYNINKKYAVDTENSMKAAMHTLSQPGSNQSLQSTAQRQLGLGVMIGAFNHLIKIAEQQKQPELGN